MNSPEPAGRVIGVIGAAADAVLAGLGLGVLLRVISRRCDDYSPHFLGFISVVGSPTSEVAVSFFIPHLHLRRYMALNFRVWPAACPRCALVDVVGRIPANSALLELVRVQRGLDNGEGDCGCRRADSRRTQGELAMNSRPRLEHERKPRPRGALVRRLDLLLRDSAAVDNRKP
jgi:hypothetical protein